jgi:hypothetical protein
VVDTGNLLEQNPMMSLHPGEQDPKSWTGSDDWLNSGAVQRNNAAHWESPVHHLFLLSWTSTGKTPPAEYAQKKVLNRS